MKLLLSTFILLLAFACLAHANLLVSYHEYISPDKVYAAQVSVREGDSILVIKNQKTGSIESSMTILFTPVLYIQWAPDSESLVVLQHQAGCSLASLIHHSNNEWIKYDCPPPLNIQCRYSVVGINFLKDVVRLTYRISQRKGNGEFINFKLCVFDVNYNTGFILLDKIAPLTNSDGIKLLEKADFKWKVESQQSESTHSVSAMQ